MANAKLPLLEPPNPAKFEKQGARILAHSIYHYAQQSLNRFRIENGIDPVPDRFPLPDEYIESLIADTDEIFRDFGRVLKLLSEDKPLRADELYRDLYRRAHAKNLKEYRKQLARVAASKKSVQAHDRKQIAIELARQKIARRPGRSNRAIALDLTRELGGSEETIRKYLPSRKRKPKTKSK